MLPNDFIPDLKLNKELRHSWIHHAHSLQRDCKELIESRKDSKVRQSLPGVRLLREIATCIEAYEVEIDFIQGENDRLKLALSKAGASDADFPDRNGPNCDNPDGPCYCGAWHGTKKAQNSP